MTLPFNVWQWHSDSVDERAREIVELLSRVDLNVTDWSGRPESDPGIVVISTITPSVCELVHFASHAGRNQVLVIVFSDRIEKHELHRLLHCGADDIFVYPSPCEELAATVQSRIASCEQSRQRVLIEQKSTPCIGSSAQWQRFLQNVIETTAENQLPVLLTGESGTGKEGVAKLVHQVDYRPNKGSFVVVDCTTLGKELSGSELFGHVKGAYTGAANDRDGAFSMADEGTLFLDEVGELPLGLQAELLRVLQERTFKPVGSNHWRGTDFRLISATNRDLKDEVAQGRFRHDLYYRLLGGCHFHLPPLKERREDIIELASFFLNEWTPQKHIQFAPEVAEYLKTRDYPGNIRELKSVVGRMLAKYSGVGPLTLGTIPKTELEIPTDQSFWLRTEFENAISLAVDAGASLKEIGKQAEEAAIRMVVTMEAGNLQRAADRLKITDRALQLRVAARRIDQTTDASL